MNNRTIQEIGITLGDMNKDHATFIKDECATVYTEEGIISIQKNEFDQAVIVVEFFKAHSTHKQVLDVAKKIMDQMNG